MADLDIKSRISVDASDLQNKLPDAQQKLTETATAAKKAESATGGLSGNFGNLRKSLSDSIPALGGVSEGVGRVSGAFKALLANPIVLLLAGIATALYGLFKAFTSTADGADQLSFVFEGMKAVVLTVRDTVLNVGSAIVKFFKGDFKGAMEDGKKAVQGFGDKAVESFNNAYEASKKLDEIEDRMKELDVQRAKSNAAIKATKELLNDENATYEQKKQALVEVGKLEQETSAQELDLAKRKIEALKLKNQAQIENNTLSQDQIDEMQQAEIAYYNKQEELTGKQIQLQRQQRTLDKQKAAEDKAEHDAAIQRHKERIAKIKEQQDAEKKSREELLKLEKELQLERLSLAKEELSVKLIQIEDERRARIESAHGNVEAIRQINENARIKLLQLQQQANTQDETEEKRAQGVKTTVVLDAAKLRTDGLVAASRQQTTDEQLQAAARQEIARQEAEARQEMAYAIGGALSGLTELIGQETAVGKGIAASATAIDTYKSASSIFAQAAKNPITITNPAYPYLMAAPAVLGGLARVKQILSVKVPKGGAGAGGSAPSAGATVQAPVTPQATTTRLDQQQVNQIGNAAAAGAAGRAYVLDSDYRDSNELNGRLSRAATIG